MANANLDEMLLSDRRFTAEDARWPEKMTPSVLNLLMPYPWRRDHANARQVCNVIQYNNVIIMEGKCFKADTQDFLRDLSNIIFSTKSQIERNSAEKIKGPVP